MGKCPDRDSEHFGKECQCADCMPMDFCAQPNGCVECDGIVTGCERYPSDEVELMEKLDTRVPFVEIPIEDVPRTEGATYRGIGEGKHTGIKFYGKGLYSTTDLGTAKEYGNVIGLIGGMPENPLIIDGKKECLDDWCRRESGIINIREFNKLWPDVGEFIMSKGYDGVIDGVIVVKYA